MNHDDKTLPDSLLREALTAVPQRQADHLDEATLAALLDDELAGSEQEAVEDHLASCPACRDLAIEAAAALDCAARADEEGSPGAVLTPDPSRWGARRRVALAMAAALVIAAAAVVLFGRLSTLPDLEGVGVTTAELESAGPSVRRAVRQALRPLPPVVGLSHLDSLEPTDVVRAAEDIDAPLPLSPRWGAVASRRPEFVWQANEAASWELLVVDDEEELIAAVEFESSGNDEDRRLSLPEGTKLAGGGVYLWKVNVHWATGATSSAWVPFRVLMEDEAGELDSQIESAGPDPFLKATVLAAWGLDAEALDALEEVPTAAAGNDLKRRFARALLERQALSEYQIERELARRLGGG